MDASSAGVAGVRGLPLVDEANLCLFVTIGPVVVHRRLCSAAGDGINTGKRQSTTADEFRDSSHRCGLEVSV